MCLPAVVFRMEKLIVTSWLTRDAELWPEAVQTTVWICWILNTITSHSCCNDTWVQLVWFGTMGLAHLHKIWLLEKCYRNSQGHIELCETSHWPHVGENLLMWWERRGKWHWGIENRQYPAFTEVFYERGLSQHSTYVCNNDYLHTRHEGLVQQTHANTSDWLGGHGELSPVVIYSLQFLGCGWREAWSRLRADSAPHRKSSSASYSSERINCCLPPCVSLIHLLLKIQMTNTTRSAVKEFGLLSVCLH